MQDIGQKPSESSTSTTPSLLVNTTLLPVELVDVLNHAFFLHLLATDPERILPPGKSLLSALSRPHTATSDGEPPSLHDRVEDAIHRAFWDEAQEALSNTEPSVQLPRLKRLYEDLHEALVPLLPATHPVLVMLSSPLSPTSAPLRSAVTHLREVLASLRTRCAPARDGQVDALLRLMEPDGAPQSEGIPERALAVVDAVRAILRLAEAMKDDLSQFVLGSMGEAQLRGAVVAQARQSERGLVLQLWSPARVREVWRRWVGECEQVQLKDGVDGHTPRQAWVTRLMQALGSTTPVACVVPPSPPAEPASDNGDASASNILPPPFFFTSPTLLYLQNYLQALVIAASLRSLIRTPAPHPTGDGAAPTATARIWALLRAEIDGDADAAGDATKLANLADELVRTRGGGLDAGEEARVRAAVDRTLRPHDPVFALLQTRLLRALAARVGEPRGPRARVPDQLRAGRGGGPGRGGPRMVLDLGESEEDAGATDGPEPPLVVKGFEDEVLVKAVGEAVTKLRLCVQWTEKTWADVVCEGVVGVSP